MCLATGIQSGAATGETDGVWSGHGSFQMEKKSDHFKQMQSLCPDQTLQVDEGKIIETYQKVTFMS